MSISPQDADAPNAADAADLAAALRATADLVAQLPRSIEQQLLRSRQEFPVEIVHGAEAQWEAWARYAAEIRPVAPINCYPGLEILRAFIAPEIEEAAAPFADADSYRSPLAARALISADAVATAEDHAVVERLVAAGMEVRLHARIPSWLYADAGLLSALPLVWGEHPPSGIMIIRDPVISTALAGLLEPLWREGEPYRRNTPEWADTLRLAGLGMSDKAIAAAQGVSHRTVQRRFAEAMEAYGARSRFELGGIWQQHEQREQG